MFEIEVKISGTTGEKSLDVVNNVLRVGTRVDLLHINCNGVVTPNYEKRPAVRFSCNNCDERSTVHAADVIMALHVVLVNEMEHSVQDTKFVPHHTD